jgi:hypothetical protein
MPNDQSFPQGREGVADPGRRAIMERVALGGAALAAVGLAGGADAAAVPDTTPCGAIQTVLSGKIRRVVTGVNADGKSTIVSDTMIDVAGDMWKTVPEQPLGSASGNEPPYTRLLQSRFGIESLRPSTDPKPTHENRRGFHTTPGVTHIFVLSGTVSYLTDLDQVTLNAGDTVIQRNSAHAWRNDGTEPVKILVTLVQ